MADLQLPLPADLPENWTENQIIAPNGADAGLSQQHGYNYLMGQVNAAQLGVNAAAGAIAPVEPEATASQAYAVNSFLIYDDQLYRVTAAIAQGDALTVGTNLAAATVSDYLSMVAAAPNAAGFAPAGYGLGESALVQAVADANDITLKTGYYRTTSSTLNLPFDMAGTSGVLEVVARDSNFANECFYTQYSTNRIHKAVRMRVAPTPAAWSPWEWVNPPLALGTEYRTTERFMGKPVYVQCFDMSSSVITATSFANNGYIQKNHGISDMQAIVDIGGYLSSGTAAFVSIPGNYDPTDSTGEITAFANKAVVGITNYGKKATYDNIYSTRYLWLKYTKTTG